MSASVSIIVVNFNGQKVIEACLRSILNQTHPPDEVIVVDNASSDGSQTQVARGFPSIRLIELGTNKGYAGGCNVGIRAAKGQLIAVLNNDVVLNPRWLEEMLKRVREPYSFWASLVLFASTPDVVDSAGDGMAVIGSAFKRGHGRPATEYQTEQEVFGACAAAALYRRSMLDDVGCFDDDFFLIYEDADLNTRARLLGYRCLFVPTATVLHHVNASIRTFSHNYVFYGHRNSEYVYWQSMPGRMLIYYLPERILFNLISFAFFAMKGRAVSFLKAKIAFLSGIRMVLAKRRTLQHRRRIRPADFRPLVERNWFANRRKAVVNS